MLHVVVLAVGSAFYPLGLAAVLVILAAPRPLRMLVGYLLGGALVSVGLGLLAIFVLGASGLVEGSRPTLTPALQLAMGALALLIAYVVSTGRFASVRIRRPKPAEASAGPSWSERVLARGSGLIAFFVGMAMSLPSVYYIAALPYIVENYPAPAAQVALVLLFNAIQFAFVEIPLIGFLVAPERTAVRVRAITGGLRTHAQRIVIGVVVVIGVYLVVVGLVGLS